MSRYTLGAFFVQTISKLLSIVAFYGICLRQKTSADFNMSFSKMTVLERDHCIRASKFLSRPKVVVAVFMAVTDLAYITALYFNGRATFIMVLEPLYGDNVSELRRVAFSTVWCLSLAWLTLMPSFSINLILAALCMDLCNAGYKAVTNAFQVEGGRGPREALEIGFKTNSLVQTYNNASAPFILNLFILELVVLTTSLYSTLDSFTYDWDPLFTQVICYTFLEGALAVFGLMAFTLMGQALENSREEAKDALEDWARALSKEEEAEHGRSVDILLRQMDRPGPISPYGFFSVNNATCVAMTATTITYIIVLLQFKQSEG